MNKSIHFFDLDYTLWNTNSKWWIIDKNNPEKYITRLSAYDGNLILSGYHRNDNLGIYYNGIEGWLSQELFTKIQRIKPINLKDIGLSFREYQDINIIEKQASQLLIYVDRIKHLQNTTINLLTARGNKSGHKNLLDKLYETLKQHNIIINESYFVNDPKCMPMSGSISEKKLICILQNIIGHKIENGMFLPMLMAKYDDVHFYDDEEKNIEECKRINFYISEYLKNTQPWLKQRIIEGLKFRDINLHLHLVTTNELNPFDTSVIKIRVS